MGRETKCYIQRKRRDIIQLAEKKREGRITEIKIEAAYEGMLAGTAFREITHSMLGNEPGKPKDYNKERIGRAIAAMYLTGIIEEENTAKVEVRKDIMNEIKTGLEKPENYCLAAIIKQEAAKYQK
jgi:hypothetical protein